MSDRPSALLPTSGFPSDSADTTNDDLAADLDLGFDGTEDILRSWRKGMRPERRLEVRLWRLQVTRHQDGRPLRHRDAGGKFSAG